MNLCAVALLLVHAALSLLPTMDLNKLTAGQLQFTLEGAFRKKNCDDQRELDLASGCLSASCCSSPPQYAGSLGDEEQQRTLRQDLAYRTGPELVVGFREGHCCSSHYPDLLHGQLLSTGN